jgi:hypothetical protein
MLKLRRRLGYQYRIALIVVSMIAPILWFQWRDRLVIGDDAHLVILHIGNSYDEAIRRA